MIQDQHQLHQLDDNKQAPLVCPYWDHSIMMAIESKEQDTDAKNKGIRYDFDNLMQVWENAPPK